MFPISMFTFGFRCVRRITPPPRESFADLTLAPPKPSIRPISDEAFWVFLDLHAYDESALDSRVERVDDSSPYWRRETVSFKAAYGKERVIAHLFLPRNSQPPYQVIALVGGATITDVLKRVEDFDWILSKGSSAHLKFPARKLCLAGYASYPFTETLPHIYPGVMTSLDAPHYPSLSKGRTMNRFEKVPLGANRASQFASHRGKAFWFVVRMAEVPCSRTPSLIRLSMALRGIR